MFGKNKKTSRQKPRGIRGVVWEWTKTLGLAIILALVLRSSIVCAFTVPTGSMEDTIEIGDWFFVSKMQYGLKFPFTDLVLIPVKDFERRDIVVFYRAEAETDYIKRIIGLPGDVVEVKNKAVYVNGKKLSEPYVLHRDPRVLPGAFSHRDNAGPITVPSGKLFVMGDNRDNSFDSRFWGFVDQEDVKGKALFRFFSWDAEHGKVRWPRLFTRML